VALSWATFQRRAFRRPKFAAIEGADPALPARSIELSSCLRCAGSSKRLPDSQQPRLLRDCELDLPAAGISGDAACLHHAESCILSEWVLDLSRQDS